MEMKKGVAHLGPGEGRSLWVLGGLVTYKVTSEQTNGAYSLFESVTQPQEGVPPYLHHREDESSYVIEGEFFDDERTVSGGPGTLFTSPRATSSASGTWELPSAGC